MGGGAARERKIYCKCNFQSVIFSRVIYEYAMFGERGVKMGQMQIYSENSVVILFPRRKENTFFNRNPVSMHREWYFIFRK